ncbi:class I SAM-dependent methyltransferase [Undibacterium sp. TJN19]|uniref:class I SAM-dependent methyltransferase n=1 Tax=Undibacterium sp. TJN19 TaxID=3413055 RepID=UPI003BF08EE4
MHNSKVTIATFNKLAQRYQDKYMHLDTYDDTYDFFCTHLPRHAQILELACGPGNATRSLLARRPDFQILGTDMVENMLELARANNPTALFDVMDCRDFLRLGRRFDAIICAFGLPYISREDTVQLIANSAKALEPQGLLYLSMMEGDEAQSGYQVSGSGDQVYIHYHQHAHLARALKMHGFTELAMYRKPGPAQSSMVSTDLFMIASYQPA